MYAIKTEGLTKKYKDVIAVDSLDLEVKAGELFSLLGVNGAGKTTTVKMLCGLVKPTAGEAYLNGNSVVRDSAKVKRELGISPQETAIAPNLTVEENLRFLCGVYGYDREKTRKKVAEIVESFSLQEVLRKKAGKLSGGWQRRVSIAMALVGEPKILFLDEPTLGLDVLARSALWERIAALKGRATVLLTTHYMEEAEALSDRVGVMKGGKLIALGSVEELKSRAGASSLEKAFIALVKGEDA